MSVQENTPSGPPSGPPTAAEPPGTHEAGLIGNRLLRVTLYALGCIFAALGLIGAFLPVVPTVPFLLVAVWCFSRSSPRFEAWLLDHKYFGPPIRQWRASGAIPLPAKLFAVGSMVGGFAVFLYFTRPPLWLAAIVAAFLLASAAFVVTRPSR